MEGDGNGDPEAFVERAYHGGDDFEPAHVLGGAFGNPEDDGALEGFSLEKDRLRPFEVVDVEVADGVMAGVGLFQHACCID